MLANPTDNLEFNGRDRWKHRLFVLFVYFFVLLTGMAGLIYEVTWQKYLSRLAGSDTIATAIIIGTFLGGLAAGYYICGKLSARFTNPLKIYALLEGIIGIWCLLFPGLFDQFYGWTTSWSFEPPTLIILQGVLSSVALFGIPTICMGATVPLLTRGISSSVSVATKVHAKVYGINTAGGFLGTLAAGFWVIPQLGLPLTMMSTSLLNLSCALFFLFLSRNHESKKRVAKMEDETPAQVPASSRAVPLPRLVLYTIAFLSGLYVMTFENVLIRIANLSFGSSSYSFSLILSVFLLAIAIGSWVVSKFRELPSRALYVNQLVLTLALIVLYLTLDTWPYWAHVIRVMFQANDAGFVMYYVFAFLVLALVLLLPLSFCGATVPIIFHLVKRDLNRVGQDSGIILSLNTVGNLLGSIIGGVVVFYVFDIDNVFILAISLAGLSTLLASLNQGRGHRTVGAALLVLALVGIFTTPLFDSNRFAKGLFRLRQSTEASFDGPNRFFDNWLSTAKLLSRADGPTCSVAVIETPRQPTQPASRAIYVNGKSDSDTYEDLYTTRLLAHIPSLLAGQRKDAFAVGLGTGVTVAELAKYDYENITVAEISPQVVEALPYFEEVVGNIKDDQRIDIRVGDAFRILGRSDRKWDVVVSEPSNPWVMGVDMLFSEEFYRLVDARLAEDGVFLQWMHVYAANHEMVGMVASTLIKQFPAVHVFESQAGDLLFVGAKKEFVQKDLQRAEEVLRQNPQAAASLRELNMPDIDSLLLRQIWTTEYIVRAFSGLTTQTLDNPRLHYMAGKAFYMSKSMGKNEFFPSYSGFFADDYLLNVKTPGWYRLPWTQEIFAKYTKSLTDLRQGTRMPAIAGVQLAAHRQNPDRFPLRERTYNPQSQMLIEMISSPFITQEDWTSVGLGEAPLRVRADALLSEMSRSRSWMVPYPVDGLKGILEECTTSCPNILDRNWSQSGLIIFALLEGVPGEAVRPMFQKLVLDAHNQPVFHKNDRAIWRTVERLWSTGQKLAQPGN